MSILTLLELEAKDGKAEEMLAVLTKGLVDTRKRPGCESVTVHRDHDRPNVVLLVERWATREDDDAYRAWRAGEGAMPEMAGLVGGRPSIRYFDDVPS